jgi:hypothetical protein
LFEFAYVDLRRVKTNTTQFNLVPLVYKGMYAWTCIMDLVNSSKFLLVRIFFSLVSMTTVFPPFNERVDSELV